MGTLSIIASCNDHQFATFEESGIVGAASDKSVATKCKTIVDDQDFNGGSGNKNDPFVICDCEQLQNIGKGKFSNGVLSYPYMDRNFILGASLDLGYQCKSEFLPIGSTLLAVKTADKLTVNSKRYEQYVTDSFHVFNASGSQMMDLLIAVPDGLTGLSFIPAAFTGNFNGNGYALSGNLFPSFSKQFGLFSLLGEGAKVSNLIFSDLHIYKPGAANYSFVASAIASEDYLNYFHPSATLYKQIYEIREAALSETVYDNTIEISDITIENSSLIGAYAENGLLVSAIITGSNTAVQIKNNKIKNTKFILGPKSNKEGSISRYSKQNYIQNNGVGIGMVNTYGSLLNISNNIFDGILIHNSSTTAGGTDAFGDESQWSNAILAASIWDMQKGSSININNNIVVNSDFTTVSALYSDGVLLGYTGAWYESAWELKNNYIANIQMESALDSFANAWATGTFGETDFAGDVNFLVDGLVIKNLNIVDHNSYGGSGDIGLAFSAIYNDGGTFNVKNTYVQGSIQFDGEKTEGIYQLAGLVASLNSQETKINFKNILIDVEFGLPGEKAYGIGGLIGKWGYSKSLMLENIFAKTTFSELNETGASNIGAIIGDNSGNYADVFDASKLSSSAFYPDPMITAGLDINANGLQASELYMYLVDEKLIPPSVYFYDANWDGVLNPDLNGNGVFGEEYTENDLPVIEDKIYDSTSADYKFAYNSEVFSFKNVYGYSNNDNFNKTDGSANPIVFMLPASSLNLNDVKLYQGFLEDSFWRKKSSASRTPAGTEYKTLDAPIIPTLVPTALGL